MAAADDKPARRITDPIAIKGSTTMTKTTSTSERTRTLRVQLVDDGNPHGLRHVDSLASMLTVTAGPLPVMNAFTKNVDNKIGYMDYVCEGPLSYIGHGYAERRLGEKFSTQDRDRIEQAYVVHSRRSAFRQGHCRETRRPPDRDRQGQSGAARQ